MFAFLFCLLINYCWASDPVVTTHLGTIQGTWKTSFGGRKFAAFDGVPYAKPPTGHLRLEDIVPAEPWTGTLKAKKHYSCIQNAFGTIKGSEDCLYVTVNVPRTKISSSDRLPVVVFVHGGGFSVLSYDDANAKYVMDSDLIFVGINYRLGPLGFMSTEDSSIPGNLGLKDQAMALKWVQENIHYFGGNKDSVTFAGGSAGAACVHFHFLSHMSRGLFHRAIQHGGSALSPWAIRKKPLGHARKLAGLLGCPTDSTKEMKKCFKTKPAKAFVEHIDNFYGYEGLPLTPFGPVIEEVEAGAFINKNPYEQMKNGDILDVPLWLSTTTHEGLLVSGGLVDKLGDVDKKWVEVAQYILDYNETLPETKREEVAEKEKYFYLGKDGHISKDTFQQFTEMITHRYLVTGTELAAQMQSKVNNAPVYYHVFGYNKGKNKDQDVFFPGKHLKGVFHNQDTLYFYGNNVVHGLSQSDKKIRDLCQRGLVSFATTGKPSLGNGLEWKATSSSGVTYLNLTDPDNLEVKTVEDLCHMDFWNTLGFEENKKAV